jgi:ribosomal protein S18
MDVDSLSNIFLNNYFSIVYTSFPLRKIIERSKSRQWITMGITTSCNHKRQLCLLCKDSNGINLIKYYKQYCKILSRVITEAKRTKYNNQNINSTNKMKTKRNIIKSYTNRLKGSHINYKNSPDSFNDRFLSTAERIMQSIGHSYTESTNGNRNPMYYMSKISHNIFPNIKLNNTSTKKLKELSTP